MTDNEPQKLTYKRTESKRVPFYEAMLRRFAFSDVSMRDVSLLIFGNAFAIEKLIENKDDKLTEIEKSILSEQIKIAIEGIKIIRQRVFLYSLSEEQGNLYPEIREDSWI